MEALEEIYQIFRTSKINRKHHWKIFRKAVKFARNNNISNEQIAVLNAIDNLFYNEWKVPKIPIIWGTIILIFSTLILEFSYWFLISFKMNLFIAIVLLIIFSLTSLFLSHSSIHLITGRLMGIHFQSYFVFSTSFRKASFIPSQIVKKIPVLGIKFDLESFLKAKAWKRTIMFISAPIITNIWFILNYLLLVYYYSIENILVQIIGIGIIIAITISLFASYFFFGDLWKARQDY